MISAVVYESFDIYEDVVFICHFSCVLSVLASDLSSLSIVMRWFLSDPVVIFAWAQTPESFPTRSLSAPTDSFFVHAPDL
jgi:hypothetical protein